MRRTLAYDPWTGVRTDWIPQDDGKVVIYEEQDMRVAKHHEKVAEALRNDDDYRRKGVKKGWMHVARIPTWVHAKLITEYGIKQPLRQGDEVLKVLQRDFPWCMTARGRF